LSSPPDAWGRLDIGRSLKGGLTGHPRSDLGSNSGCFTDEPVFVKSPSASFSPPVVGALTSFSAGARVGDDALLDIAAEAGVVFSPSGRAGRVTTSSTGFGKISASRSQRQLRWLSIPLSIA